MSLLMRTP